MSTRDILQRVMTCDARTVIANAFRRAFGLPQIWDVPHAAMVVSADRYADIEECFANHVSPWRS